MGGGKAVRRRAKNAEKANVSLHKAALGKAGASAHIPLPSAPTRDDYTDKMPASLRRMLALKEVAEQPVKRQKLSGGHSAFQQPQQQQQQRQALPSSDGQPGTGVNKGGGSTKGQDQRESAQQQQHGASSQQPKKLKQKKKDYLNAKKLKKKRKGQHAGRSDDDEVQVDQPAFGEVVHAPPEVALKSKHWAVNKQQQQQQQAVLNQQRGKGSKRSQREQQHVQREPKRQQAPQDEEQEQLREQVIESYRATRPTPREGFATLKSLKQLVRQQ